MQVWHHFCGLFNKVDALIFLCINHPNNSNHILLCKSTRQSFLCVFGRALLSTNIPLTLRKEEGAYIYSLSMVGILCLFRGGIKKKTLSLEGVSVRTLLPPTQTLDLHMFRFMITFTLCFTVGKGYQLGTLWVSKESSYVDKVWRFFFIWLKSSWIILARYLS
jgi:hypothetical protein